MSKLVAIVEHRVKRKKKSIIWLIISSVVILLGFTVNIGQRAPMDYLYTYYKYFSWYHFRLFMKEISYDGTESPWTKAWGIRGSIFWIIILIALPQIIILVKRAICDKQAQLTSLYVDSDKVYGSFGNFSKKEMVIPIEQLDNVIVTNSLGDRIRSGKTLTLCSASGKIRFHFIQNADEVSAAILTMINDYKKNYGNVSKPTVIEKNISSSDADELKKFKDLLDSGVISQEEFDAKKKQLLGL